MCREIIHNFVIHKMSEEFFKNVVIHAADIANTITDNQQKEIYLQDIERLEQKRNDYKKTTIILLEFFKDERYRDRIFTLDDVFKMIEKNLIRQLKCLDNNYIPDNCKRMDETQLKWILETLISNGNLRQVTMDSVTHYGLKAPAMDNKC